MEGYNVLIEHDAKLHLVKIYKSGNQQDIKRVERIIKELHTDPKNGIGKPERLKYELSGFWSRRINKKIRLIYSIEESEKAVIVISAIDHYGDT